MAVVDNRQGVELLIDLHLLLVCEGCCWHGVAVAPTWGASCLRAACVSPPPLPPALPLVQAVLVGKWVVIEDINMAPPDLLAALVPLLERRVLHVPSRGQVIPAAPGFILLATVTSAPQARQGGALPALGGAYATSNTVKVSEKAWGVWRL